MKILQTLVLVVLLCGFSLSIKGQECGYVYITVYLTDNAGELIKNAQVRFFDTDFKIADYLHRGNIMKWDEKRNAYFGVEGMCGGERNIGMRISAKNFEVFEKVIDLPLGSQSFSVKLKSEGTNQQSFFEPLAHFSGKISAESGAALWGTQIILTNLKGEEFLTTTTKGYFSIDVSIGEYKIKFIQTEDFLPVIIENKKLVKGNNFLEVTIKNKNSNLEKENNK